MQAKAERITERGACVMSLQSKPRSGRMALLAPAHTFALVFRVCYYWQSSRASPQYCSVFRAEQCDSNASRMRCPSRFDTYGLRLEALDENAVEKGLEALDVLEGSSLGRQ